MSLPVASSVALRSPTIASPAAGPTRLRVPDLLHATDQAADDVLSGRCDHLLPDGGVPDSQSLVHPHPRRRRTRRLADQLGSRSRHRIARPRWLVGRADRGVRVAERIPLGRAQIAAPPPRRRRPGRLPAGLGARRGVGAQASAEPGPGDRHPDQGTGCADAERARLLAAAEGDVVLRGHRNATHCAASAPN